MGGKKQSNPPPSFPKPPGPGGPPKLNSSDTDTVDSFHKERDFKVFREPLIKDLEKDIKVFYDYYDKVLDGEAKVTILFMVFAKEIIDKLLEERKDIRK